MIYRYGQIEIALIKALPVREEELGSFRAKLRRFRELGIPSIEKAGSGANAEYRLQHAVELAVALTFASLGVMPKWLKGVVDYAWNSLEEHSSAGDEVFIMMSSEGRVASTVLGRRNLASLVQNEAINAISLVNLSEIRRRLQNSL